MIYSSTELETTDDNSVSIGELAKYLRNSNEFKDITQALLKIENFSSVLYKAVKDVESELEREEPPHTHTKEDIEGLVLFTKEEAQELIDSSSVILNKKIEELKDAVKELPEASKTELEAAIKLLKKEIDAKLKKLDVKPVTQTTIVNQVEEKRLAKIEKGLTDIISLLDGIVDKAEEDLRNVQQKLLNEFSGKIKESNKKVTIVGGVNPALNRFLELLDVDTANLQNGYVPVYNSVTKKMEFTPQASGGVESVTGTGNITVDNTDPANPVVDGSALVPYTGATGDVDLGSNALITTTLKADGSGGLALKTNSGSDFLHGGDGGSPNATMYGGWNYDNGTANTILSLGASKTLTSLSTATYPSLTELSYVKGVTSAIQTQLDGKQATLVSGTNIKTINGSSVLGSGDLTVSATPAGSTGNIQYNTSNAFDADPYFNYDETAKRFEVFGSLGTEIINNGSFTGSASGWTLPTGWAYSSNSVSHSSNGTGALAQTPTIFAGELYVLTLDVSNFTVGSFNIGIGGISVATISANGSYSFRIAPTNSNSLNLTPTNTSRFTVDNVSLKKLSGGSVTSGSIGIGGANYAPTTTPLMLTYNHSNGGVGTTRATTYNNYGSNTWLDFLFSGVAKAHIGASSGGELSLWASGSNYVGFYNKATSSLMAYLTPSVFAHYGMGLFGDKVHAGANSTPSSTLQSAGSFASKVTRVTSNTTLDSTATKWLCDASSAACSGTPSNSCSSYVSEGTCLANDAHGGCSWFAGNSCNVYNGDQSSCESTSGCTYDQASCSAFGDESTCNSYSGCSWGNNPLSCSGFDEATCGTTSGCTVDTGYCSSNYTSCSWDGSSCSGGAGCDAYTDQSSCESASYWSSCSGGGSCSSQGDESSCNSYSYYNGCSGSYDNYSCTGSYYTGTCSGTYGASCSGTASCSGINDSTSCGAETGCTWATALTMTLPAISYALDRDYWIANDSSSGADCILQPASGETIDATTSYTLAAYKDWVHISPFIKTQSCSVFDGNESSCSGATGCSPQYSNCSWNYDNSTCGGNASCTGYTDQFSCESATYYSGCGGTNIISKNWYVFGR